MLGDDSSHGVKGDAQEGKVDGVGLVEKVMGGQRLEGGEGESHTGMWG